MMTHKKLPAGSHRETLAKSTKVEKSSSPDAGDAPDVAMQAAEAWWSIAQSCSRVLVPPHAHTDKIHSCCGDRSLHAGDQIIQ